MVRYFCDACGKEICGEWIRKLSITATAETISQFRGGGSRPVELHFHQECMGKMLDYLAKEEEKCSGS